MASEAPKDSETKTREIKPITQPIVPLTAPAAQTFIHVHPLLLSAYFLLRFPYLVADPVSALLKDLFPIAAIQCAYAAICLPVSKRSGSSSDPSSTTASTPSKTKATPKPRGSKASSIDPNDATPATRITNALLSLLLTATASVPTFFLLVLFGAPITTHQPHTFLTAAHFALLAFFPLFYAHGVDKRAWWEIGGAMLPFDQVWGASVGTALGAWLGAIPIPLDWDREWQKWPVTIVAGMYAGAVMGGVLGGSWVLKGRRMEFKPDKDPEYLIKRE